MRRWIEGAEKERNKIKEHSFGVLGGNFTLPEWKTWARHLVKKDVLRRVRKTNNNIMHADFKGKGDLLTQRKEKELINNFLFG